MENTSREVTIVLDTPAPPPYWALLERELLRAQAAACEAFYARYFDERGYQLIVPRWGGNDGPDDAAENLLNWTMLHALGAPDRLLELYKRGWEGHLRQYTEARTIEVPLGRDGMYYKEFPPTFDWFHIGEGLSAFILQGLSDPDDAAFAATLALVRQKGLALRRFLPERGPAGAELRSPAADHPQHVQWQSRAAAAAGDHAGLGRRPDRGRGAFLARPQ